MEREDTQPSHVGAQARLIAPVRIGAAVHSLKDLRQAGAAIRAALKSPDGTKPRVKYAVDGSHITIAVQDTTGLEAQSVPDVGNLLVGP